MQDFINGKPNPDGSNATVVAVRYGPDQPDVNVGLIAPNDLVTMLFGGNHEALVRIGISFIDAWSNGVIKLPVTQHPGELRTEQMLLGKQLIDLIAVQDTSNTRGSLWGSFDRTGINRMIKILRKARDVAFGRDE